MLINTNSDKSLFLQIIEGIEDAILSGIFIEESQIPSTTEISIRYKINPGTAQKGISKLVDDGIIYKKRGLGMFVARGAADRLYLKRKDDFFENYISAMIAEAKRLKINEAEVKKMIESGFVNGK